jgi:hypothetical protein
MYMTLLGIISESFDVTDQLCILLFYSSDTGEIAGVQCGSYAISIAQLSR